MSINQDPKVKTITNFSSALKYKEYKNLKYGVPKEKAKAKYSTPTKNRIKVIPQFHTPHKTSSPQHPETPIDVDELGPTPQLNGRVLGLFEVITSPKTTPQTSTVVTKEETTLTPAKKNLDFSQLVDDDDEDITQEAQFKTPQKPMLKVQETPLYLRPGGSKEITASPSPLATQRIKKGLTTIISEFRDIQAELKYGDFDEEELDINPLQDIEEEAEDDEEENSTIPKWKKKKTQKRTTRRYVIKARPTTDKNTMEGKDVQKEIAKLSDVKQDVEAEESEESEEWSDGPDEYIPKARKPEDPSSKKRKTNESQNFKRLKLRDRSKKRNFGKKSRGW